MAFTFENRNQLIASTGDKSLAKTYNYKRLKLPNRTINPHALSTSIDVLLELSDSENFTITIVEIVIFMIMNISQ